MTFDFRKSPDICHQSRAQLMAGGGGGGCNVCDEQCIQCIHSVQGVVTSVYQAAWCGVSTSDETNNNFRPNTNTNNIRFSNSTKYEYK